MRKDALESLIEKYYKDKKWTVKKDPRIVWLKKFLGSGSINLNSAAEQPISLLEKSTDISLQDFKLFLEKNDQKQLADGITADALKNENKDSTDVFKQFIESLDRTELYNSDLQPSEIRSHIASFLDTPRDVVALTRTSSAFYREGISLNYWRKHLIEAGCNGKLLEDLAKTGTITNYKNLYRAFSHLSFSSRRNIGELWQLLCLSGEPRALEYAVSHEHLSGESQKKYDVNALHYTALSSNANAIDYMIAKVGMNPQSQTSEGLNVLHYACYSGNLKAIKRAASFVADGYNSKTNNNMNVFHATARSGSVIAMAGVASKMGFSLDTKQATDKGYNILHYAAASDNPTAMSEAISTYGIDPKSVTSKGSNALHLSMESRNPAVMQYAKNKLGLHSKSKDFDGMNALHYAAQYGNTIGIDFAIHELSIDPLDVCKSGKNILHYACMSGDLPTIHFALALLREKNPNKDPTTYLTNEGENALHIAAQYKNVTVIKFLIHECGFSPEVKSEKDGLNVLQCAVRSNNIEAIKFLLSLRSDPQFKNKVDPTATDLQGRDSFWYADTYGKPKKSITQLKELLNTPASDPDSKIEIDETKSLKK